MSPSVFHQTFRAMGTRFSLVLPGVDEAGGHDLAELARVFLRRQEHLLSRFDLLGPLAELNEHAAAAPVAPPPALWEVLQICRAHWRRTAGRFDITLQPLARAWREAWVQGRALDVATLAEARALTGFAQVEFDEAKGTVRFARPGMSLDLGGFGKGWALDGLRTELIRQGVTCALLSFGESSVAVVGRHPSGRPWPVGIADLFEPGRLRHRFALEDAAISTSGNAPRRAPGEAVRSPGHIIDPVSGRPVPGFRTVSVCAPTAADAEALSTALFVLPPAEWVSLLAAYPGATAVESDGTLPPAAPAEGPVTHALR